MGRPKGSKNIRSILVEETAAKLKFDPFHTLCLYAMRDWKALGFEAECYFSEKPDGSVKMNYVISPELSASCAKDACSYLYAKKQTVALTNAEGNALEVIVKDFTLEKKS